MKSNLDLIKDCDQFPPNQDSSALYRFCINGYDCYFGHILESTVKTFSWPACWEVDHNKRVVKLLGSTLEERNTQMHETLIAERERKSFKLLNGWANEIFAVYGPEKELILSIERVAAPLFGIVTYGVQLLAYQQPSEGVYKIWIARRAKTKRTYPSMLDSTVGGSLPTGEKPFECLIRESIEEASFPEELVRAHAKACGTVNYVCLTDHRAGGEVGLMCPEVQFTYEIQLPEDITPVPGDGEAESIILFTIDELKSALAKGDFTPANGCIVLDFFVRHGIITYENEKDYIDIASRLHRVLEFPTA